MFVDVKEWRDKIEDMCDKIKKKIDIDKVAGVYGVPRGGVPIAIIVSLFFKIPLLSKPVKGCIVIDDLIDSGSTRKKYNEYPFFVLYDKRKEKINEWITFWYEDEERDDEELVTRMIERIGENPKRLGLIDTPRRVVKMWKEVFRGYDKNQKPTITTFENGKDGIFYDQMIIDSGDFFSHCEHHMVSFFGRFYFAYIPDKKILGLSKVARIVDYYSAKLQIQERLVKEILDEVERVVKPKGCALIMKGRHLCKEMRGARKKGVMITSDLRGIFKTDKDARSEFLRLIK